MGYKSIVVHVQPDPLAAPRLEAAVHLARELDAVLIGVGAEMIPSAGVFDPFGQLEGQWFVQMQAQLEANLAVSRTLFETAAKGLASEWRLARDLPARAVSQTACGADLIVAGGAPLEPVDVYRVAEPAALLIESGRPVLVAPPTGGRLAARRVVLAWKNNREARRALADALPLLKRAEEVVVMRVCVNEDTELAKIQTLDAVTGLARHGVKARSKVVVAPDERACAELNIEAQSIGADLIVAGGYGRSRMREWALGGLTRDLLTQPERFVMLSH